MNIFTYLSFTSIPNVFLLTIMLCGSVVAQARDDPYYEALRQQLQEEYDVSGGEWLVGGNADSVLSNRGYGAEVSEVAVEGQPFSGALRVKVTDFGPDPFNQGLVFESQQAVTQGDVVLLTFYLRGVSDEVVRIGSVVEGGSSGNRSIDRVIRITSSEWTQIILPAEIIADHPADEFRFQVNLGYLAQEFEIGGIALLNYGDAYTTQQLPSVLPALTYEGIEPDAPWRAAAQQRIEENRRGDLTVRVVDEAGNPVPDAQVQVNMTQHAFGFGTAVSVSRLAGFVDEENIATYRERLYDLTGDGRTFNVTTAENALKWPNWEGTTAKDQIVEVLDNLRERGIRQRGHALVWGGSRFLPTDIVAELDKANPDTDLIQQRIQDRITDAMQYPGLEGKIDEWDVANEPLHEDRLYDALIGTNGYTSQADIIADWLRQARAADPEADLLLNEYDIWNNSPFYINEYKKLAEAILDQGAPLDGLGIQAHMGAVLPPIETLYAILDNLATTGLDLSIAEFDAAGVTNDSVAAVFLRDAMTIAFSHPAVTDFIIWGFWDRIHWLDRSPLFYEDFTPKPGYDEYVDLVFNQWWTDETGTSSSDGTYAVRGFLGDYQIDVITGQDTLSQTATLTSDGTTVTVTVGESGPVGGDEGSIVINAQGDCGVERMELRVDGEPVDAWTVSTNPDNYLYEGFTGGEVSVHFLNDSFGNGNACDDNNLMVDFIEVCGVKYQTETVATKSVDCCQVPDKLYTNGNFNFGSLSCPETTDPDPSADGQIVIRAKGDCGSETMILEVDGQEVETWTQVATSYDDYPYAGYQGGTIKVKFVNNQSSPCDRNLYVDYIEVCGTRIQSESSSVVQNTNWTNGDQQILFSNGDNNYGNPGCGSARTASGNAKERFDPAAGARDDSFRVYPNPASDELTVRGGRDYQVTVYDLSGRPVMQHQHLRGQKILNTHHLHPGVYLLTIRDVNHASFQQRIVIE